MWKEIYQFVSMRLIIYRKTYDMFPHFWIKECLDLSGVTWIVKKVQGKSMEA